MSNVDRDAAYKAHVESVAGQRRRFWLVYLPAAVLLAFVVAPLFAALFVVLVNWYAGSDLGIGIPLSAGIVTFLLMLGHLLSGHRYPRAMTRPAFEAEVAFNKDLRAALLGQSESLPSARRRPSLHLVRRGESTRASQLH